MKAGLHTDGERKRGTEWLDHRVNKALEDVQKIFPTKR
jgi:hypothetical protein